MKLTHGERAKWRVKERVKKAGEKESETEQAKGARGYGENFIAHNVLQTGTSRRHRQLIATYQQGPNVNLLVVGKPAYDLQFAISSSVY